MENSQRFIMEDFEFIEWLRLNCTTKHDFYLTHIEYWWTLNKDYEGSWDGEDVNRYTSKAIYEYYAKTKNDTETKG